VLNRMPRDGMEFEVVPRESVPAILDELREVSDEWLEHKGASEKGFSMGAFDPDYLSRFPVALIRVAGRVMAFSNVWTAASRDELSVDLMRFREDAPKSTMEALFASMLRWGKEQGYAWFSLGMAPLAGLQAGPVGHPWSRVGHWLFRHGEAFYNFQGLRGYKEKFHPRWEPRYLAYPGGIQLPRILADVAALIAGGYRRIFT
jgi:phosphatidylglycerol lysyltransferase